MIFLSLVSLGQVYPSLNLSENPDTTRLHWNEESFSLRYRSNSVLDENLVIAQLNSFLRQQQSCDWLTVVAVEADYPNALSGQIVIEATPNTTNAARMAVFVSLLTARAYYVVQHIQGELAEVFDVDGGGRIYPGKKGEILLSGSTVGVNYELCRDGVEECIVPGTGSALIFKVESPGTYTVKAVENGITCSMAGQAVVEYYPVLNGKITIVGATTQSLSMNGGVHPFQFKLASNYAQGAQEIQEIVESCMAGESEYWDSTFLLQCGWLSSTDGYFVVVRGPNLQDETRYNRFMFNLTNGSWLSVSQPGGGDLIRYEVTGGGSITPGETASVSLTAGQIMVDYSLYCNDSFVVKQFSNYNFTGLTTYGHYKIKAEYDGREVWMSGDVGIWPSITSYAISGGGTVYNGNPVQISLSGSQPGLTYRLCRNGSVVSTLAGTGTAISFYASDAGVYSIEGGLQDHYVSMSGTATIERSDGIYYTTTRGYKIERLFLDPTTTNTSARSVDNVVYFDGLGRNLQEIQVCGSPGGTADIIVAHAYGPHGQVERTYLPYNKNGNNGTFISTAFASTNWNIYGTTDAAYAFTKTEYDNSPLARVVKQTGVGKAWHTANKSMSTVYGTNTGSEVRRYQVSQEGTLSVVGHYAVGSLQKVIVTDEDGYVTETFMDNSDRILLSVNIQESGRLETYSVYDDRGLLRYVLSPEASSQLGTSVDETVLQRLAYRYDYDCWGRLIKKRLPGCEPVYMVYDQRDRLVMSQDGNQRAGNAGKWSYSLYDDQNRVIETGEVIIASATHASLQDAASRSDNYIPSLTRDALQYTAYDTYTTVGGQNSLAFKATSGYSSDYCRSVTGLITNVRTRVLGTNTWLTTTTYYDEHSRVIQTVSDNYLGYKSYVDFKYDFVGNVCKTREAHGYSSTSFDILETTNNYDDRGRLLSASSVLNGGTPAVITYSYDAVGRLVNQKYGNVTETLTYNARGWLTAKISTPFKMKLRYESPEGGTSARWNGNISEWEWQQGTNTAMMYGFTYDKVNRLTGSTHYQKSGTSWSALLNNNAFDEKGLTYDKNGNILTLSRTGTLASTQSYTYAGNQLARLSKGSVNGSYLYDKNGNMINDSRKNLNLSYNVLNLLSAVKTGTSLTASYSYLADGTKLGVIDASNHGFYYLGSLTYVKNGSAIQLENGLFGKGRILANASTRMGNETRYFLTDHLGSVRVIIDQSGAVKERNDYYPFGGRYAVIGSNVDAGNRWKYNGKEEQVTGNLEWLDYGARMYDWELGRWFNLDPMSEKYYSISQYVYCLNIPIRLIDIDGNAPGDPFKTINEAAKDFGRLYNDNSIVNKREYAAMLYQAVDLNGNIYYSYSEPSKGSYAGARPSRSGITRKDVGVIHSHGNYDSKYDNNNFSSQDKEYATQKGIPIFVSTPNGSLQKYDPNTKKLSNIDTNMPSDPKDPNRLNKIDPFPLPKNEPTSNFWHWFRDNVLIPLAESTSSLKNN